MARRRAPDPSPSLFPFLSVLAAVMGTLTLVIAGMSKIALASPKQRVEVERLEPGRKTAVFVECRADGVLLHPPSPGGEATHVSVADLGAGHDAFSALRSRLELDPTRYLQLLVRADGISTFHRVRESVSGTGIELGYQPLFGSGSVELHDAPGDR